MKGLIYKVTPYLRRHSPTILSCVAAIGVVATVIVAVRNTPKAIKLLKDATDEKGEELTKLEAIKVAGPVYVPAAVIGLSAITCIFGANLLNRRQQASIASAYALLSQSYHKYQKAANKVFGEDADSRIKAEIAKETYVSGDGYSLYDAETDPSSEKLLFYDELSQRYFQSTLPAVMQAQYHINRNFILRGEVSINEFYTFLGMEKSEGGDDLGWGGQFIDDGCMWIDFENKFVKLDDGIECYIISSLWYPHIL